LSGLIPVPENPKFRWIVSPPRSALYPCANLARHSHPDTAVSRHVALCLIALGLSSAPASAAWLWPPPLTAAQRVRDLSPGQAEEGRAVRLTGVVTHINPHIGDFWVQDATAGIYVRPTEFAGGLGRGDEVEVVGATHPGDFAPSVTARAVKRLGKGKLPDPYPYNLSVEDSRWLDAQWVQGWGVVQQARSEGGVTLIDVYSPHGTAKLVIPGEERAVEARRMRGQAVIVRGVCVPTFDAERVISGSAKIYLAELPAVLPAPAELPGGPEAPSRMIDHFLRFSPHPHPGARRVKVAGVVTAMPLPGVVIIQDASGGATLWVDQSRGEVVVGASVEAYGMLRIDGHRIGLTRSTVTVVGPAALPPAVAARPDELAAGTRDATLVRLEGTAGEVREVEGWTAVALTEGGLRFVAYVPGLPDQNGLGKLEPGTRVAVIGVPVDVTPAGKAPTVPGVFLRAREALTVLEIPPRHEIAAASWWTSTRARYLIGGFAAVVVLGGVWLLALRVQVRHAAREIERQYEEKANLERQLRQAAKLEAVGRLAGGIAHDFNNLLTVINGCAELLAEEPACRGGRPAELTEDIRQAGERAAGLTGQLLTFSRKREVLIAAVDLNEVVAETVRLLDRVIGEDIRIETDLAADLPAVRGEAGMLNQVVMNLAVNAKDAMPHGGVLSFATTVVTEPAADASGLAGATRRYVRLTVSDTGLGMTEEVKARIFEPFFTTKEIGNGTGLGLATVYGIVQTVRGRIRVESAVGRGTKFYIDFRVHGVPVSDAELALATPPTPLPAGRVPSAAKLAGMTVLVVEDNEMVRDTLVNGLAADGATVLAAARPDHALRVLAAHPGRVDVLVTDVVMPGMSGPARPGRACGWCSCPGTPPTRCSARACWRSRSISSRSPSPRTTSRPACCAC
jgi:two-component system, cell cycle sensor histidine kinase and response regulator CckA